MYICAKLCSALSERCLGDGVSGLRREDKGRQRGEK